MSATWGLLLLAAYGAAAIAATWAWCRSAARRNAEQEADDLDICDAELADRLAIWTAELREEEK